MGGDVVGNFTILAMALLIILLNKRDDDDDNPKIVYDVDDRTIIKTLLQFYPKGIEQGKYHDKNRQLKGGSKFLGILHFILENDDEEDQHIIYQNNCTSDYSNEQPEYFAATEYCSQSLVEPHNIHNHNKDYNINNNDVNVVERIYELLRANPAAILLATTTTTSRTVLSERRRRQQRTALAMATAATTSATSIIAPTVTPSKPVLAFGQVSEVEVEGVGVGKQQLTSNITTTTTTTATRNDGDGDGINPHGITNGDDNNDNNIKAGGDGDDDDAATIVTITPNSKRMRLK